METRKQEKKSVQPRRCCLKGDCPTCLDNARWERVFREKFADPFYYSRKPGRSGSPISDF